jgi:tRNA1(Val) A37 N6-methylase TrmN6
MLYEFEKLEPLGDGVEIIVSELFHFSTDTILLADFARPRRNKPAVDLGSGCGTIPFLWARRDRDTQFSAVELQPQGADMIRRTAELNRITNVIPVNADLKLLKGVLPFGCFDLVSCNPPYKEVGTGLKNPDEEKMLARHEESCTVSDVCEAAKNLLQFGGRFCMCQRPDRLCDVMSEMRRFDLEPKRLRFVQQRPEKAPKLFLIEGRRGGKRGGLVTEPTLFIEENGDFSPEMKRIYGSYKEGHDE